MKFPFRKTFRGVAFVHFIFLAGFLHSSAAHRECEIAGFRVRVEDIARGDHATVVLEDARCIDGKALKGSYRADIDIGENYSVRDAGLIFDEGSAVYETSERFVEVKKTAAEVHIAGAGASGEFKVVPGAPSYGAGEVEMPWLRMLGALATVLALFCAGAWVLKRLNRGSFFRRGRYVAVLDCVAVGKDLQVIVLEVAGKILVLTAGKDVQTLAEFDEKEFWQTAEKENPEGFGSVFKNITGVRQ